MPKTAIISVDGHAKASRRDYRWYLPKRYREAYDEEVRAAEAEGARDAGNLHPDLDPVLQWDSTARLQALEQAGVVAEVLFPNGQPFQLNPYDDYPRAASPELLDAGRQAYNRWLVDFCAEAPARRRGQAQVSFSDPARAVADIHWAKDHGLSGIILPELTRDSQVFYDEALKPIWAALTETGLCITVHGGASTPDYGRERGFAAMVTMMAEAGFWSNRSLWQLIAGGVFDDFPSLKVAYVETQVKLLVAVLVHLDAMVNPNGDWMGFARTMNRESTIERFSSDYLGRNVFVGVSPFSPMLISYDELVGRDAEGNQLPGVHIGADAAMCGVDFPQYETVLDRIPEEVTTLATAPAVTDDEARAILFDNAAALYGFDPTALETHVDRVGFDLDEVRANAQGRRRTPQPTRVPAMGAGIARATS